MDYVPFSAILHFDVCETRQCVDLVIMDDMSIESDETFHVSLEGDLNSRIHIIPDMGIIEISNNDCMTLKNIHFVK